MNIPFLDRLAPKRTVQLVSLTMLLLFGLAYQYAFKNTWQLYSQQQNSTFSDLDPVALAQRIKEYEAQLAGLNQNLGAQEYQRNLLFERCGQLAVEFDLQLVEFSDERSFLSASGVERILNEVHLTGNYEDIVRFVYALEEVEKKSRVISSTYLKRKNLRSKKTYLTAVLTLENFRLNSL